MGSRRGVRRRKGGAGAAAGPPVWVPYPQGVVKGEVDGNVKRGRQKWVHFGNGETPYKVAAQLCFSTEATATARSQKAIEEGGGGG